LPEVQSAFVSCSRDDSEFALRLARDLKAAGARVWLDQLDIEPGHPWDNAIEEALKGQASCDAAKSFKSNYARASAAAHSFAIWAWRCSGLR